MSNRWQRTDAPRGEDYDARWDRLAKAGIGVHGETDLIKSLLQESGGRRVLDAGCGTGRVAIELSRRGYAVVGMDADEQMLAAARAKAPEMCWLMAI
jgi:ubiquinone/menaquinone biosynthesis C-methylase UbiE